jgi:alkylhydroperoxidase family enzyme
LVREGHVPDAVYEKAKKSFSEEELVNLTLNGWNRLAISAGCRVSRMYNKA